MKSILTSTIKIASLSIILFSIAYGVYAQHKLENILDENTSTAKYKTQTRTTDQTNTKLADLYSPETFEDAKKVESWMLVDDFWNIEYTIEQEPTEKEREIEEWMIKFDCYSKTDNFSGFHEKDWMKKHSFYIL